MLFREKLSILLREKRLDVKEVSSAASIPYNSMRRYLSRDSTTAPDTPKGIRLARVLEVPVEWLFDDGQDWPPPSTAPDIKFLPIKTRGAELAMRWLRRVEQESGVPPERSVMAAMIAYSQFTSADRAFWSGTASMVEQGERQFAEIKFLQDVLHYLGGHEWCFINAAIEALLNRRHPVPPDEPSSFLPPALRQDVLLNKLLNIRYEVKDAKVKAGAKSTESKKTPK